MRVGEDSVRVAERGVLPYGLPWVGVSLPLPYHGGRCSVCRPMAVLEELTTVRRRHAGIPKR